MVAESFVSTRPFDETLVSEIQQKWPVMIEVTNRLASAHDKIYKSSKVDYRLSTVSQLADSLMVFLRQQWRFFIRTTS